MLRAQLVEEFVDLLFFAAELFLKAENALPGKVQVGPDEVAGVVDLRLVAEPDPLPLGQDVGEVDDQRLLEMLLLGADRVVRPSTLSVAAEAKLIEQVEQAHPLLLKRWVGEGLDKEPLRIAGIDPHGLDLAIAERLERIPFPRRLDNSENLDNYLQEFR